MDSDFEAEIEDILWDDERKPLLERTKKEIERLRDYGSPETKRALKLLISYNNLWMGSPYHERTPEELERYRKFLTPEEFENDIKIQKINKMDWEKAQDAIKELPRLLDEET